MSSVRKRCISSMVSIHAPHEGERLGNVVVAQDGNEFQSTLPTRGSDLHMYRDRNDGKQFQSTLPTRGSDTPRRPVPRAPQRFQSTLPTRGSDQRWRLKNA